MSPKAFHTVALVDRDGCLIEDKHYLSNPDDVVLFPRAAEALRILREEGVAVVVTTNQSGVGRDYFPIEQVHVCQRRLFELLEIQPEDIAGWCIAPEAPGTEGGYRKPSPRFIQEALKHLGAQNAATHMIGDTLVDLETAWNTDSIAWAVGCGKPQLSAAHLAGQIDGSYEFRDDFPACLGAILNTG